MGRVQSFTCRGQGWSWDHQNLLQQLIGASGAGEMAKLELWMRHPHLRPDCLGRVNSLETHWHSWPHRKPLQQAWLLDKQEDSIGGGGHTGTQGDGAFVLK